jgi:SAM-dependent methyltransferase
MYSDSEKADLWWHRKRQTHVNSYLHQCLKKPEVTTFLEVGCAEGYYINLVSRIRRDINCVGVDIALPYLKKVKLRNPNAEFILCDAEFLPFKKRAFNLVLCSEVLEHVPNYPQALKELLDVSNMFLTLSFPGHSFLYKIISPFPPLRKAFDRVFAYNVGHISDVTISFVKSLVQAQKIWRRFDIRQSGALPIQVYNLIPSIRLVGILDDIICNFLTRKGILGITTIQVIKISAKEDGKQSG